MIPGYVLILSCFLLAGFGINNMVSTYADNALFGHRRCIVLDAGHGGIDGGAVSCTGAFESNINLEIALRLDDLFHLLGIDTVMIRRTDCSVYTSGDTIAAKKVSDLKERVRIVNSANNAMLVSIHQNNFLDSRYSGAQVFYGNSPGSDLLAKAMQDRFVDVLNPGSNRQAKKADGVYLMQHISCTGVLVECGFLSNPQEEAKLRSDDYQKKIACVIASVCSEILHSGQEMA